MLKSYGACPVVWASVYWNTSRIQRTSWAQLRSSSLPKARLPTFLGGMGKGTYHLTSILRQSWWRFKATMPPIWPIFLLDAYGCQSLPPPFVQMLQTSIHGGMFPHFSMISPWFPTFFHAESHISCGLHRVLRHGRNAPGAGFGARRVQPVDSPSFGDRASSLGAPGMIWRRNMNKQWDYSGITIGKPQENHKQWVNMVNDG